MFARARQRLLAPNASRWVMALAMCIALPSVAIGFYTDDYTLFAFLAHAFPHAPAWYDLYGFVPSDPEIHRALLEQGFIAWWSAPDLRVRLLRPLASALVTAERASFGDIALLYHLHSLAWYGVLLSSLWALYRRMFSRDVAVLALLVFGVSSANLHLYGWISARHMLLSATFVVLALLFQLRAEQEGCRHGRALSVLLLVLALLSGESGLCGIVYFVVRALCNSARRMRARLRAAFPYTVLAIVYLGTYAALGGGAAGSGMYISPIASPLRYARAALLRVPALLGNALLSVPADLINVVPPAAIVALGTLAALAFAFLLRRVWHARSSDERATLRWCGLASLVCLFTVVGGSPGSRMLALPNVGFAPVCATVLLRAPAFRGGAVERLAARVLTGIFAVSTLLLSLPSSLGGVVMHREMVLKTDFVAAHMPEEFADSARFVMVAASDPLAYLMPRSELAALGRPQPACWSLLSGAHADHRISRIGPRSLRIEPLERTLLEGEFERLYRTPELPFQVGDEVVQCDVRIRVAALRGGLPSAIEAHFATLDAPSLLLARWDGQRFVRFAPPALGESTVLRWHAGPTGLF